MNFSDGKDSIVQSSGFLLTRRAFDGKHGLLIHLWLKGENGPIRLVIEDELAVFFVESERANVAEKSLIEANINLVKRKAVPLKTFAQVPVEAFYFKYLRDFYAARECLGQLHVKCYEDDIRPDDRYLMERFITAGIVFTGVQSKAVPFEDYRQVKCKPSEENSSFSVVSLDIECSMKGELYSIGLYAENYSLVFMIATEQQQASYSLNSENDYIEWVKDERSLLSALVNWFDEFDPDIIIGWNVIQFDFNLLQKRFDHYQVPFEIGRDRSLPRWRTQRNSEQKFLDISGRVVIDGIDLLKTATYSFNSFSLENVAQELLGIGKKVEDVENRVQEITDNFNHDKVALAAYNLEDCRLVLNIFEHTNLIAFAKLRAELTGLAIDRIGGSVAAFTNLYLPKLHRAGYVAPNMGDGMKGLVSPGGYVMDSIPGLYKNVLILDFKSLYPSIIRTFNVDPMGMVEGLRIPNESIEGFDGAFFSRDKHFLPEIIESLWQQRDIAKRDKNAALSQAIKIIMNSFYGILGSTGCRFFDPRLSGSITKRSHELLKTTQQWIEEKGYQVIYGDTDSIFVHVGDDLSPKQCTNLGKELADFINEQLRLTLKERFNVDSALEMEFETHFNQFFMPTVRGNMLSQVKGETVEQIGTKKRYVGQVVDDEGKSHLIFKGLETVRSDWTELAKSFQKSLYQLVFANADLADISTYILSLVEEVKKGEWDDRLVYRKRLRRKLELYVKNVPPHVKAARYADQINEQNGNVKRYQNKGWISYVITVSGPQAIEHKQAEINYQHYIDKQLKTIADDILPFIDTSFEQITDQQLSLF